MGGKSSGGKQYCDCLDQLFLNSTNDNLLLDLECCTDAKSTFERIKRYFDYETNEFNTDLFGKTLFCCLRKNYHMINIELFVAKCYELYKMLPLAVESFEEPFHALCYIDDILEFEKKTCLKANEIVVYLKGFYGYGWHISDLVIYDKPKELSEFYAKCNKFDLDKKEVYEAHCTDCGNEYGIAPCEYINKKWCIPVTKPPQSWCYVESEVTE